MIGTMLAGASKGPMMFSLALGMDWCANSHWANNNYVIMTGATLFMIMLNGSGLLRL